MSLIFSPQEAASILSLGADHPVTEDSVSMWARAHAPRFTMEDLLAAHLMQSFALALPDTKPTTAAWLAKQVVDKLEGTAWGDLPKEASVALDDAGEIAVRVNVAEHADVLKERVAVWMADADERVAGEYDHDEGGRPGY